MDIYFRYSWMTNYFYVILRFSHYFLLGHKNCVNSTILKNNDKQMFHLQHQQKPIQTVDIMGDTHDWMDTIIFRCLILCKFE